MDKITEMINVEYVGPYGPKVNGVYYRLGKAVKVGQFKQGNVYSVEVGLSKTKAGDPVKYINAITSDLGPYGATETGLNHVVIPTSPLNPTVNQAPVADSRPRRTKFGDPLTDYDLEHERMIRKSGLVQAALHAVPSHVSKRDDIAPAAIAIAEELLKWVETK